MTDLPAEVREQWALIGEPWDPEAEDPAVLHVYDDRAEAEELQQWVPGSVLARRIVTYGSWSATTDDR